MKYRVLRYVIRSKQWANTEKGEKVLVSVLSGMSAVGVISFTLLVIGIC